MKVVVVTPSKPDSALAIRFLAEHGIGAQHCHGIGELLAGLDASVGCVVLVEESLVEADVDPFHAALQAQPPWSDLPLLVIAGQDGALLELIGRLFPHSGNVTLLQRPIHPLSLVSAVNVALRSRARQLEVRDLLEARDTAVRKRDEFLAMLAHELRNPLAPIRNAVYLLGTLDYADPLFLKCRSMIDKQARHVTRLVDDLLDVSRLELGKVELRPQRTDLNDSVAAAVESCAALTAGYRHAVNLQLARHPLPVRADPVRLEQAVCNLLVNAAKFTPEGGSIEVATRLDRDAAVVAVKDNGMGIKPEMLESIFDLFTQDAVPLARTKGGLGIGLTLVKRLIELHGGTVRAFSEGLGSGSLFEAYLPLDSYASESPPASAVLPEVQPKRVLIVEDGADTRDSLGMLIRAWHHEVLFASNGPEGVDRAREAQPDVALIDIGLPGFDGYQVARRIRRESASWQKRVWLIALTGYGQANDRARALDAGFDVHVLKPVDPAELRLLLG
jgi:two-component system, sensor histidine kinase